MCNSFEVMFSINFGACITIEIVQDSSLEGQPTPPRTRHKHPALCQCPHASLPPPSLMRVTVTNATPRRDRAPPSRHVLHHCLLCFRVHCAQPVVIAQDRFEFYHPVTAPKPANWSAPNFFRGLMWASLVSGGHATYGGIATWDSWISGCSATKCPGVRGYADMVGGRVRPRRWLSMWC